MPNTDTCQVAKCGRPADGWFVCAQCADELTAALHRMPWLLTELDLVMAMLTRYTTGTDGSHGNSQPPGLDWAASQVRGRLVGALTLAATTIGTANGWAVWSSANGNPTDVVGADAPLHAAWLAFRITAIRLHPEGPSLTDQLVHAHDAALTLIDRPQQRQYLGDCADLSGVEQYACPGQVYGREWRAHATCDTCGLQWDANELRRHLVDALTERLVTAAEIARLATYLNLTIDRVKVRKRINQWHHRGLLISRGERAGDPAFRFGDANTLLARYTQVTDRDTVKHG